MIIQMSSYLPRLKKRHMISPQIIKEFYIFIIRNIQKFSKNSERRQSSYSFSERLKLSKTSNTQLTPLRSIWGYRPYTSKTYLLYLLILFFITALRSLFVVGQRNTYIKWNSICFFIIFIIILKFQVILLKLEIITTSIYLGECILTSLFLLE